jgi:hypothetical protein
MADYYYISDGAEPRGPFAMDQLRSMWRAGQITATSLYCPHGSEEWRSIDSLGLGEIKDAHVQKTVKNAYLSWSGLGLFDLIPGIRNLPYFVRFALMVIVVLTLCLVLLPKFFQRDSTSTALPMLISGTPPSVQLAPCFAAILAPLSEGVSVCDSETISQMLSSLQAHGARAADSDKEIYSTATDIALLLQDGLANRNRHLEKSTAFSGSVLSDNDHRKVAVDTSWQRNVETLRSQIRILYLRLLRLEGGRFHSDSASASDIES